MPHLSRRAFLRGVTLGNAPILLGLPVLDIMLNGNGTAFAAKAASPLKRPETPVESRFVLWFNGNGVSERYWIPKTTGPGYELPPCLAPLAPFRNDMHVITGLDNPAARMPGPGNDHHRSMSALMTGCQYSGRGAGGPSIDHLIAGRIGGDSRFRSLQIGVSRESFGESIQRNMSWADRDRALPPEMIPYKLFDRLFGEREDGWIQRKRSVLDAVQEDAVRLKGLLGRSDQTRLEEHLASIREVERAIASLPPEYHRVDPPEVEDMKDWPRVAKIQSDLLVHALATRQTRVASYMLTKCQGLARFPWLGLTAERHHDYTHSSPGTPRSDRIMRDICRWHNEEFAYLLAKLKSIPEGDRTLLDHTCVLLVHEHAEANDHKNNGLAAILAGHVGGMVAGVHSKMTGTIGDLYLTVADNIFNAGIQEFPTAGKPLPGITA